MHIHVASLKHVAYKCGFVWFRTRLYIYYTIELSVCEDRSLVNFVSFKVSFKNGKLFIMVEIIA